MFQNTGNELAQFWETGSHTNGTGVGPTSTCPSQGPGVGWWQFVGTTHLRGIRGFVSQPGCVLPGACPLFSPLTFLVEDQTTDGSDAGFIAYSVDPTQSGARTWDLARTDPNASAGSSLTHVMRSYPTVVIVSSTGTPPNTMATNDYPEDVGVLFHGVEGAADTPLPASAQLASYDVMAFNGTADPGRERSLWALVKKIPYMDAAIIADTVEVPCPSDEFTFFAIGITWDTGLESELVGKASLPVTCDPNVAEPEPSVRRLSFRPGHAGRR